jgi:methionyl-tRNA formyltransferase
MNNSIVFFGSSAYSIPVLQTLLDHQVSISLVVTTKDKPAGRHLKLTPNPLKQFALERKLTIIEKYSELINITPRPPLKLRGGDPQVEGDIGLVAAFGRIIPQEVLDKFNTHIYNIHPSLLPKYRGPSPLQTQILDGITTTGVSIIQLDAQMDHGPIVAQETDTILDTDTPEILGKRLFVKGTEIFIKWLNDQMVNDTIRPQNDADATYTTKLTRQDGFITYEEYLSQIKHPTAEFRRKFRAYYPWPGVWTTTPTGEHLKILTLTPRILIQVAGKPSQPLSP